MSGRRAWVASGAVLAALCVGVLVGVTRQDSGVRACQDIATRVAARRQPTDAQRALGWSELEASRYRDLADAGVALRVAWERGDLAEQVAANLAAAEACASHGVAVTGGAR